MTNLNTISFFKKFAEVVCRSDDVVILLSFRSAGQKLAQPVVATLQKASE